MNRAALQSSGRFHELDSLRGLAAFTVVIHHFYVAQGTETYSRLSHSALRFLVMGNEAVILFFVLSGFVLTLPYERTGGMSYGKFIVKRICRIYLPYLGALALAVAMNCFYHGMATNVKWIQETWNQKPNVPIVVQHVLFLGDYDWNALNSAFWSLIYEMRISLIFPFLAIAALRFRAGWMLLFAAMLSLSARPLSYAICLSFGLDPESLEVFRYAETLQYTGFFVVGAVLAKNREVMREWYKKLPGIAVPGLYILAVVLYSHPYHSFDLGTPVLFPGQLEQWSVAAGAAIVIALALSSKPFQRVLHHGAVAYLGKISYSLYLLHVTVLLTLIYIFHGAVSYKLLPFYLAGSVGVASMFYYLVEKPSMLLGQRLGKIRS
ncbi:MAG: acyltransferase [Bryobacteraceae bacterium]|jgi:peptidoglycan/LPS O-acetylase OafA/YrhL